jgi:vacuolar iron transporter family protein
VPLVVYLLPVDEGIRFPTAIGVTLARLFVVGASRTLVTKVGLSRSGAEMLAVGAFAAAVAYGVGALTASLT